MVTEQVVVAKGLLARRWMAGERCELTKDYMKTEHMECWSTGELMSGMAARHTGKSTHRIWRRQASQKILKTQKLEYSAQHWRHESHWCTTKWAETIWHQRGGEPRVLWRSWWAEWIKGVPSLPPLCQATPSAAHCKANKRKNKRREGRGARRGETQTKHKTSLTRTHKMTVLLAPEACKPNLVTFRPPTKLGITGALWVRLKILWKAYSQTRSEEMYWDSYIENSESSNHLTVLQKLKCRKF